MKRDGLRLACPSCSVAPWSSQDYAAEPQPAARNTGLRSTPVALRTAVNLGLAAMAGVAFLMPSRARADNPIIQTLYTADPAPMVHEGTLYLYTTHDEDVTVNDFFTMNDWRVYSTKDVVNWTDHGSPLHYRDFAWAGGSAWAGQVIFRNGKFYFYVPVVRTNGGNAIGVAVSDSPTGPFTDAIGSPLVTSDCGDIDPTPFIDDDGQAYLYWGNPNLCYVKLNEDMTSYQGGVVKVQMNTGGFGVRADDDRPTSYEEGPWFYRRDGGYYLVYPGGPLPEHIAYSTSSGPTGPWTYKSVIMPAEGSSFTNHPGIVDFGGKSLFFYHNGALPGGGGFKRSVCVEEFTYDGNGGIPQIRMTTRGAGAVATLDPFEQVEAETIAWSVGVETEVCNEGGMNVTDLSGGDYIKVANVDFGAGATTFEARVASGAIAGAIELRLDGADGMLVGSCPVASTGGAQTWATQSCDVDGATGTHDLFLRFTTGGFKFNWWKFSGPGASNSDSGSTQPDVSTTGTVDQSEGDSAQTSVDSSNTSPSTTSQPTTTTATVAPAPSTVATTVTTPANSTTSSAPPASTDPPVVTSTTGPSTSPSTAGTSAPPVLPAASESSACGCRVGGRGANGEQLASIALLGALGLVRRRAARRLA